MEKKACGCVLRGQLNCAPSATTPHSLPALPSPAPPCSTGLLTTCGIQLPTSPPPSSQQCVDGFNAAAATCKTGAAADCCTALSGLGSSCLADVLSEFSTRGDSASFTAL